MNGNLEIKLNTDAKLNKYLDHMNKINNSFQ